MAYSYIIETDEQEGKVTQYGTTIYYEGEMLSQYTMWHYNEQAAYNYARKVIKTLKSKQNT